MTDKTTTTDELVARVALASLITRHAGANCAAVCSLDNRQQQYVRLDGPRRSCQLCRYTGPFIDEGVTCPHCLLVQ